MVVAVLALLVMQGCQKTVYYAVTAPHEEMEDHNSCYGQCQIHHTGNTKQILLCLDNCSQAQVAKEKRCDEIQFNAQTHGCTTLHNHALDGTALGLGIGFLVLLGIGLVFLAASSNNNVQPTQ